MNKDIVPSKLNTDSMWGLMEELFPIHRSLVGPGFKKSLEVIMKSIPLNILEFPSGTESFDWKIQRRLK